MSTLDQLENDNTRPSELYDLIGKTLMFFSNDVITNFNLDDDISECVEALVELAAESLTWILLNQEEYTNDYVEQLFESVRSKTLAHIARRVHPA